MNERQRITQSAAVQAHDENMWRLLMSPTLPALPAQGQEVSKGSQRGLQGVSKGSPRGLSLQVYAEKPSPLTDWGITSQISFLSVTMKSLA
ncbi:hypothetical protein EYF80_004943 [Liparis tanakae]|uniref:Uncharacterized protein n=1 Tax=Liparis tanakae TaxID=230148 RepID=A0A4Z2J5H2_9TELE|nr:hypothetical protein EYF80_004943 [Liparis tanakae]